jgi:hypothetical protein
MTMTKVCLALLYLSVVAIAYDVGLPFLRRQDMAGVWRLTRRRSLLPTARISSSTERIRSEEDADIVLRLNEDGTFDRYKTSSSNMKENDDESEGADDELRLVLGRGGSWEYQDQTLFLAADRPTDDGNSLKVHDTVLTGKLEAQMTQRLTEQILDQDKPNEHKKETTSLDHDVHLSIPNGEVSIGKFMYPKKHKAFFDDPMLFHRTIIGTFQLSQLLGNLNARLEKDREEEKDTHKIVKFHKKDLHGRKFFLTSTPLKVNPHYAAKDKNYDEDKEMFDLRVMAITFHANNTFSTEGSGKVLRGRFGISGDERHKLWFQVSLFGAGRSAPGSVYSEGQTLSHEDRRGYRGVVQEYEQNNQTRMFILKGSVFYGNDMGLQKRPPLAATFSMQEVIAKEDDNHDDEDEDEDGGDEELDILDNEDAFQ